MPNRFGIHVVEKKSVSFTLSCLCLFAFKYLQFRAPCYGITPPMSLETYCQGLKDCCRIQRASRLLSHTSAIANAAHLPIHDKNVYQNLPIEYCASASSLVIVVDSLHFQSVSYASHFAYSPTIEPTVYSIQPGSFFVDCISRVRTCYSVLPVLLVFRKLDIACPYRPHSPTTRSDWRILDHGCLGNGRYNACTSQSPPNASAIPLPSQQYGSFIEEFYMQYEGFQYDPYLPYKNQIVALCDHYGWKKYDEDRDIAWEGLREALVLQFNEIYGEDENDISAWRSLCEILGVFPIPRGLVACRQVGPFRSSMITSC